LPETEAVRLCSSRKVCLPGIVVNKATYISTAAGNEVKRWWRCGVISSLAFFSYIGNSSTANDLVPMCQGIQEILPLSMASKVLAFGSSVIIGAVVSTSALRRACRRTLDTVDEYFMT
jgi:hypothetical protein